MVMEQWVNHLQNNIVVNLLPLTLLCEISGALHLYSATGSYGRLAGRQADEIR